MRVKIAVPALLCFALMAAGCDTVDSTDWCVRTKYGEVKEKKMSPGLAWTPASQVSCIRLTEQNLPAAGQAETVAASTKDPMPISGDVSMIWSVNAATAYDLFMEKRVGDDGEATMASIQSEVQNAMREGYRNALSGWRLEDIYSERRAEISDSVKAFVQRRLGSRYVVKQVFVRNLRPPEAIENARVANAAQQQIQETAVKQARIDSIKAAGTLFAARAQTESQRLMSQVYDQNPGILRLEIAKQMSQICGRATTCILGGSTMDALLPRGN